METKHLIIVAAGAAVLWYLWNNRSVAAATPANGVYPVTMKYQPTITGGGRTVIAQPAITQNDQARAQLKTNILTAGTSALTGWITKGIDSIGTAVSSGIPGPTETNSYTTS